MNAQKGGIRYTNLENIFDTLPEEDKHEDFQLQSK
jgi:hypothetical protein